MEKETVPWLIVVIVLLGIVIYLFASRGGPSPVVDYYKDLAARCELSGGKACCLSSVVEMAKGEYRLEPQGGCAPGYVRNSLRCEDTLIWCEPGK
jgi:hypothetical protein